MRNFDALEEALHEVHNHQLGKVSQSFGQSNSVA